MSCKARDMNSHISFPPEEVAQLVKSQRKAWKPGPRAPPPSLIGFSCWLGPSVTMGERPGGHPEEARALTAGLSVTSRPQELCAFTDP